MTQTITPFRDKNLRIARTLPEGARGRPASDLTSEQKWLARHLANDQEQKLTGEALLKAVGYAGSLNTFMRLLRKYNIKTYASWLQRRNLRDT
jgi:hypothetical protein